MNLVDQRIVLCLRSDETLYDGVKQWWRLVYYCCTAEMVIDGKRWYGSL